MKKYYKTPVIKVHGIDMDEAMLAASNEPTPAKPGITIPIGGDANSNSPAESKQNFNAWSSED